MNKSSKLHSPIFILILSFITHFLPQSVFAAGDDKTKNPHWTRVKKLIIGRKVTGTSPPSPVLGAVAPLPDYDENIPGHYSDPKYFETLFPEASKTEIDELVHTGIDLDLAKRLHFNFASASLKDILRLAREGVGATTVPWHLSEVLRLKEILPISWKLSPGEFIDLYTAKIDFNEIGMLKNSFPDSSVQDFIKLEKSEKKLDEVLNFKKYFWNGSIQDFVNVSKAKVDLNQVGAISSFIRVTPQDLIEMTHAGVDFKKAGNYLSTSRYPFPTVKDLLEMTQAGIDFDEAKKFKARFGQIDSKTLILMTQLGMDFEKAKHFLSGSSYPPPAVYDLIEMAQSGIDLDEAFQFKSRFEDVSPLDFAAMKDLGIDLEAASLLQPRFDQKTADRVLTIRKTENLLMKIFGLIENGDRASLATVMSSLPEEMSVNTHWYDGTTPLHVATSEGQLEIIQDLIQAGAEINQQDESGKTPLSIALEAENISVLKLLISSNAHVSEELALKYKEVFAKLREKPYKPSVEGMKFADFYIANKENIEAKTKYQRYKKSSPDVKDAKKDHNPSKEARLARRWKEASQRFKNRSISDFGISFSSDEIAREARNIDGVETMVYYNKSVKNQNRPVLFYTHGDGAKNKMRISRVDPLFHYYIAQGYVVVAPNFRGEGQEVEDIYRVARGVRKISDLGIDPDRILLTSISAGSAYNFQVLEKIGLENRVNPFAAVQFFSSIADSSFENRSANLPKNIPYLIIHGEQDDVAPAIYMKKVYKKMKADHFQVNAYFSPSGNHHMVDPKLNHKVEKNSEIYNDLAKWPDYFIPFFEVAQKKQGIYDKILLEIGEKIQHKVLAGAKPSSKGETEGALVGAPLAALSLNELDPEKIPSLKYIVTFNQANEQGTSAEPLSVVEHLKRYFSTLDSLESSSNHFGNHLYEQITTDQEFQKQIHALLLEEQRYYHETKIQKDKGERTSKEGQIQRADRDQEEGVVAYHAVDGNVVGFYHLFSAFNAVEKALPQLCVSTFRKEYLNKEDLTAENPLQALFQTTKILGKGKFPNQMTEFAKRTMSLNSTLFAGNLRSSNSVHLWNNSTVVNPGDVDAIVREYLAHKNLSSERMNQYSQLIKNFAAQKNGGMFQLFSPARYFDRISYLSESLGEKLKLKLSVSEYQKLLRTNPEKLKKIFETEDYANPDGWDIYKNPNEKSRLFSVAQIRISSSAEHTQHLRVNFFPHHKEGFETFLNQLKAMVLEDSRSVQCPQPSESACLTTTGAPSSGLSPLQEILSRISKDNGRQDLLVSAHRQVVQGDPKAFREFMKANRSILGKNEEILFREGSIEKVIEKEYHDNPNLKQEMLQAIQSGNDLGLAAH